MKHVIALSLLFALGCTGLPPSADAQATPAPGIQLSQEREGAPRAAPLPLRIPIKGVMAGVIDFSAHGVFTTATSEAPLAQDDWVAVGLASINLIGSATLITSAGSGPNDSAWIADPEWRRWATAFQQASVQSAAAIRDRDRGAFLRAANNLADACQSCHERFRINDRRSPSEFASQMADRSLAAYLRAWPAPAVLAQ
jgi:hypothetical protein